MFRLFLCLVLFLNLLQSEVPPSFYIENIEARTEYHSYYIFSRAFDIIPQDKAFTENEISVAIECLVTELKAAGIYDHVDAYLQFTDQEKTRLVFLDTKLRKDIKEVTISRVQVVGFPEIDSLIFQRALIKRGVEPNLKFLRFPFNQLERKIGDALRDAYPINKLNEDDDKTYLLTFRPDGEKKLMLIISPGYAGCK